MELFGFEIIKKKAAEKEQKAKQSFVPQEDYEGGYVVDAGGHYGAYIDMEGGRAKNERELIYKYRDISQQAECDSAIEDIVSEAIVSDEDSAPVDIILDDLDQPEKIKKMIREEFDHIVSLLNMNWYGHDIFRRWYVDGRLYFHKIIDDKNPKNGLIELRPIDATKIRKVKELIKEKDPKTGADVVVGTNEYYIYEKDGMGGVGNTSTGLKISKDAITYVTSGLLDPSRTQVLSYLNKAVKAVNQLRMMEDALVIYRLSRAPERRIFYIDVGNLPKGKAEEYLRGIMNRYRNKMVYDANTGEMKDDRKHMSMMEDFWLPRREGGRGTEISTLPGGDNLGQIEDIVYFQRRLYKALNVPVSRLDPEQQAMVSLGRAAETTRDELKFQKFVNRLRKKFSALFIDLLKTQLILKGIVTEEEWNDIRSDINIDYISDSHFAEMKNSEILRERVATLREVDEYVGRYYSAAWVRKNILMQSDEEIADIIQQIEDEGGAPDDTDMDFAHVVPEVKPEVVEEIEEELVISEEKKSELDEAQTELIRSMTQFINEK
jgi:Bacteriophage T4-like capsid assembly protein (Gp20).